MVTREYIVRTALGIGRNVMTCAFLAACGVSVPPAWPAPGSVVRAEVYDALVDRDLMWCFENHGSPMDGMR